MGNVDRKVMKQNVASMPRNTEKEIEIHRGAGELGVKIFKMAHWKTKCKSYFNRYYKTSNVIMVPSDGDKIMNTLIQCASTVKFEDSFLKTTILQSIWNFLVTIKEHFKKSSERY